MNEVEKALAIIQKYGPMLAEAGSVIASVQDAISVIQNLTREEPIDPAIVARIDAAYAKAFAALLAHG